MAPPSPPTSCWRPSSSTRIGCSTAPRWACSGPGRRSGSWSRGTATATPTRWTVALAGGGWTAHPRIFSLEDFEAELGQIAVEDATFDVLTGVRVGEVAPGVEPLPGASSRRARALRRRARRQPRPGRLPAPAPGVLGGCRRRSRRGAAPRRLLGEPGGRRGRLPAVLVVAERRPGSRPPASRSGSAAACRSGSPPWATRNRRRSASTRLCPDVADLDGVWGILRRGPAAGASPRRALAGGALIRSPVTLSASASGSARAWGWAAAAV